MPRLTPQAYARFRSNYNKTRKFFSREAVLKAEEVGCPACKDIPNTPCNRELLYCDMMVEQIRNFEREMTN